MTLTPAYGRDYRRQADALADFEADKDFILNDVTSPWDGRPCNKTNLLEAGKAGQSVQIRYAKNRKVFVVKVRA